MPLPGNAPSGRASGEGFWLKGVGRGVQGIRVKSYTRNPAPKTRHLYGGREMVNVREGDRPLILTEMTMETTAVSEGIAGVMMVRVPALASNVDPAEGGMHLIEAARPSRFPPQELMTLFRPAKGCAGSSV